MILVTGATGNVGSALVALLLQKKQQVRIFTRTAGKAAHLAGQVEIAVGDLNRAETLEPALGGIERLFLVDFSREQVENVLRVARRTGLRRIVRLSSIEAGLMPLSANGQNQSERDELIAASGLEWTFLRPGAFMSNALEWVASVREKDQVVYGGGEGRLAALDPRDIAAVAAAALTGAGHAGKIYALTGPELLTFGEMTRILGEVLGRPLEYVDIPEAVTAEKIRLAGYPPQVVDGMVEAFTAMRSGRFAFTSGTVRQVTGQAPYTFREWCQAHRQAFLD